MTFHLAQFRLKSVGERSARFADLTLDMTAPDVDGQPQPSDSVTWLRNGGGKSSLLSLFYALLLPRVYDFMGREAKRSLTDYVESGDTAHTVSVWHPVDGRRDLHGAPAGALVVGAVYEWADLRRPTESDNARDRFNATYYSFYCVPGVLDADRLPFSDSTGQPARRATFLADLRAIADRAGGESELAITDRQFEWSNVLTRRGIDPELFRTQKMMNHVEGGVEDLFRFASAREFVNFLLDLTVAPDEAATVADRLSAIATLVASKPAKQTEQEFCLAAADVLNRIHDRSVEVDRTQEELATALAQATDLAGRFDATLRSVEAEQALLETRLATWTVEKETNASERSIASDNVFLYSLRAATLRIDAAKANSETAEAAARQAKLHGQAWAATEKLAELASLRDSLEQAQQLAAEETAEAAPLRHAHDDHAASLRARLTEDEASDRALAKAHHDTAGELTSQAQDLRVHAKHLRERGREADDRSSTARGKLDALDTDVARAEADNLLPPATPPALHLNRLRSDADGTAAALEEVRDRRASRPARRTHLTDQITEVSAETARLDNERGRISDLIHNLTGRADAVAADPRLRELAEATEESPLNVWDEGQHLALALYSQIERADTDLIRGRARHFDDEDLVQEQERTGLLPSSSDANDVVTALSKAGVHSETGWRHLTLNYTPERCQALLESPELARLGCGVVVATDNIDTARDALQNLNQQTRALVGLYTAEAAAQLAASNPQPDDSSPAWTGLNPGMVNETIADAAVVRVKDELGVYEKEAAELQRQREHDRGLLTTITQLLTDSPKGHLTLLRNEVADHDKTFDELAARDTELRRQLAQLDNDEAADSVTEKQLVTTASQTQRALDRVTDLAGRAEQATAWREHLAAAERDATNAYDEAENATDEAQARETDAAQTRGDARAAEQRAARLGAEAAELQHLDSDYQPTAHADPAVSLDVLRSRQRQALHAYEVQTSSSVYVERARSLSGQVSGVQQAVTRFDVNVRRLANELLLRPEGQDTQRRAAAIEAAQQAVNDAAERQGEARAAINTAQQRHDEVRARRRDMPRGGKVTAEPTTVAEAEDLLGEWEQRNTAAQARRVEIDQTIDGYNTTSMTLQNRVRVFTALRGTLQLPEEAEPPQHTPPYPHSEDQAQADLKEVTSWQRGADRSAAEARDKLKDAVGEARTTASRFPTVTLTAKDRLIHDEDTILARTSESLESNLRLRAATISDELAGIARDQDIVATSLVNLVKNTFDTLRKAERYSLLPSNLGAWAGQKMLRIGFTVPPSDADMKVYVNRVIDRRVSDGVKPEGMPLLKDAVHEVVGPRGFVVKVLKPTEDASGTREDITRLSKWSGGEKLTVCVALYCTIAALRAANSGRKDRAGGVLLLDNPIGRASHGSLVKLQRAVAAHHKVQLVYTTGVKDPDAVSRFPNVIRLDNRTGRGNRARRYIVQAADTVPSSGVVEGVRVAHTDSAEQPVQVTAEDAS